MSQVSHYTTSSRPFVYYMLMTCDARCAFPTIVAAVKLQRGREAARPCHAPYFSDFNCTLA